MVVGSFNEEKGHLIAMTTYYFSKKVDGRENFYPSAGSPD